jgi:esterase/lipase superfamily enzyme
MRAARARTIGAGLVLMTAVCACAPRGAIRVAPEAAKVGAVQELFVASARVAADSGTGFTSEPAAQLGFAEFQVSVPPDRNPGTVSFPRGSGTPDPATDFLTVSATSIGDSAAFLRAVNVSLAELPPGQRDVFVFVHGFNTTFAEGLYRQAQMSHDFRTPGVSINFAWPSAARVSAYGADREATLVARDRLQDLLRLLARSKANRIIVMGHSMGAMVVMEAMRQTALTNDRAVLAKTDAIVLMAPDLDIGVFQAQMQPIAAQKLDVIVFTSSGDRALRLSARLRGDTARLGSIDSAGPIADLPVTVIDLSTFRGEEDALGHFKFATSPALIALFSGMGAVGLDMLRDQPQSIGLIEAGAGLVTGTTATIVEPLGPG